MMRLCCVVVASALVGSLSGCTKPASSVTFKPEAIESISVQVNNRMGGQQATPTALQLVKDEIERGLMSRGYRVADRSLVPRVQEEIEFQRSGLTDINPGVESAKHLTVPAVMMVEIDGFRVDSRQEQSLITTYSLGSSTPRERTETQTIHTAYGSVTAKLVSLSSGSEILWSHRGGDHVQVADKKFTENALPFAAQDLIRDFQDRNKALKNLAKEQAKASAKQ